MLGLGELTGLSAMFVGACALLDRLVRAVRDRLRIRRAALTPLGRRGGGATSVGWRQL
jgi:hypothetical protein